MPRAVALMCLYLGYIDQLGKHRKASDNRRLRWESVRQGDPSPIIFKRRLKSSRTADPHATRVYKLYLSGMQHQPL